MDRMSIRSDRCPTCGQAVQTHTSSEGTSCYLPIGEVERLRMYGERLYQLLDDVAGGNGDAYTYDEVDAALDDWRKLSA